ncbi:MAG TPA: hypothetical protein DCR43_08785 [Bacteroidales bacterium]|nr:MAG: hypothetical protein A2X11_04335 [Bacteroidetes bacterium GWE2_42_24]OFY25244.1 MAG: hypothetical protein A2X09_10960 [Bacteroidetes bacterium GWF2_43_11]HAQ65929.1 hypothetical protein [Bacteroidales bacterium]HBZ66945.1 hypothetical protein [Bacteroidales bacterium]
MFRTFFLIAFRNLIKNRTHSLINIIGLAVGLMSFMLIALYITDEMRYDRYHSKADRIFRVTQTSNYAGVPEYSSSCPCPLAPALQNHLPSSIEAVVRVFNDWGTEYMVEYMPENGNTGARRFKERKFYYADSTFFQIFDAVPLRGNLSAALNDPNTVVIARTSAQKYFGAEDPVGKVIRVGNAVNLTVTAVIDDPPAQSHFTYDFIASISTLRKQYRSGKLPETWIWNPFWTYVLLNPGVDEKTVEASFPSFISNNYQGIENAKIELGLQPITDIHLHSSLDYEIETNGRISYVRILGFIAAFILLIACINFMNLATAASAGRAREIGVKKVFGALRSRLMIQFVGETMLITLFSMVLALLMVNLLLPVFNNFADKAFRVEDVFRAGNVVWMVVIVVFVGFLSGTYPGVFLSAFEPIRVLKGDLSRGTRSSFTRKFLVVTQFTIAIVLIIATFVAFRQLNYLRTADIGLKKDNIIMLPVKGTPFVLQYEVFKADLLNNKDIVSVTAVDYLPGVDHNSHEFKPEGYPEDQWQFFPALAIRDDFLKTFDIPIVAGRDYITKSQTDPDQGILINEAMVKHLGWKSNEAALGKKFSSLSGHEKVIGVFRDFNARSLRSKRTPLVLNIKEDDWQVRYFTQYIAVRIRDGVSPSVVLPAINSLWREYAPNHPFEYKILSAEIEKLYNAEERTGRLAFVLSLLILFVATLGLLGLASFLAEQRTRELGIRKVMGASVKTIILLLTKEFMKLVFLSALVAVPVAWWLVTEWLSGFAYQTSIELWIFILAIGLSGGVAFLVTSVRAWHAATMNPVLALKYE